MRIGIFGGSFDPIHLGHLILAECCRDRCRLDEVWLMPTAVAPHKRGREVTSDEVRAKMIEAAVADNPALSVCRYEIDRGGINYTYQTLEHFRQTRPGDEFFFLLGADMFYDLPHWREPCRVIQAALPTPVIRPPVMEIDVSRLGEVASPERLEEIARHVVPIPAIDISSTDIRRRVAAGETIRYQVPPAVEEEIRRLRLYRGDES